MAEKRQDTETLEVRMKCKCTDSTGDTTIRCCNVCGLPLQSEPWDVPIPSSDLLAENERLRQAIRWALGEHATDCFRTPRQGDGAYWWRIELRQRAFNPAVSSNLATDTDRLNHILTMAQRGGLGMFIPAGCNRDAIDALIVKEKVRRGDE